MSEEYYREFDKLLFDRPAPGVLRVTINAPEKKNRLDGATHRQLEQLWRAIDDDDETRCSIITGAGDTFCAGGDIASAATEGAEKETDTNDRFAAVFRGATDLVNGLIMSRKPIVSAINGTAIGAGLSIALLADVPIAARTAKLIDGHSTIGIAAGDHAAIIWPLLCGMAKSKYYLMTCDAMTGEEAERNNLVAKCVDQEELEQESIRVASRLAGMAPTAIRSTKYVLNHWLRQNSAIFDLSLAMEFINMESTDLPEAIKSRMEKRAPVFKATKSF